MLNRIMLICAGFALSLCFFGYAQATPGGNYVESCHKCSWSKKSSFLRCKCKDKNGNVILGEVYTENIKNSYYAALFYLYLD